jgi:hypothetical protein
METGIENVNGIIKTLPSFLDVPQPDFNEVLKKIRAEKSLKEYVQQAWHIIERKKPLSWNWHLDVQCQHLEQVTATYIVKSGINRTTFEYGKGNDKKSDGYVYDAKLIAAINYLWFNLPPRSTKSTIISVIWPTWEWGPQRLPFLRYIFTSYAQQLSTRDSIKRRRIIQSQWYQERWGYVFNLEYDQNQKTRFENSESGYMIATSIDGMATGDGGDRIICDDPHNVREIESEVKTQRVIDTWDDSMSTRCDDDETGAYIGVMQRVGPNDLTEHLIEKKKLGEINFAHICIPARYEVNHPIPTDTPLPFKDPRTHECEPLDKLRWPDEKLKIREGKMTRWAVAGQLQQRPVPRGGGIIKVDRIMLVENYNHNLIKKLVRYWDKGVTADKSASFTVGLLMGEMKQNDDYDYDYIILDCIYGQWEEGERDRRMRETGLYDSIKVIQVVEQEGGSGGKESANRSVRKTFKGLVAKKDRPTGEKSVRLEPFAAAVENYNVACLIADWTSEYRKKLEKCVVGSVNDHGDATSGAFNFLNKYNEEKQKSKARISVK